MTDYSEKFSKMKAVGIYTFQCLKELRDIIKPGIKTKEIEDYVIKFQKEHNLENAQYGYRGFPSHCCISPNHVLCHGIPDTKTLKQGDIVSVDVSFIKDGYYGDACWTYPVGELSPKAKKIMRATNIAMWAGITQVKPGNKILNISEAIENVAKIWGVGIAKDFVGHGINTVFHCPPCIPNFVDISVKDLHIELVPGMTFTIEPILTFNSGEHKVLKDGWTTVTRDRSLAAQYEHTIGVTETGFIIFTS